MALRSDAHDRAATFAGLPMGAIFRNQSLPAFQTFMKVEGRKPGFPWILVLGGGTRGLYPSPWYGAMEDVQAEPLWFVAAPTAIAATGLRIDQAARDIVYPGALIVRRGGGLAVFIEGTLALDLKSGQRCRVNPRTAVAYAEWVIDVFTTRGQSTLVRCHGPWTYLER